MGDPADIGGGYLDGVPEWLKQEMIAKNKLNPRFNRTGKPLQTYENNKLLGIHAEHGPQGLPPGMTAEMMITPPPPPDSKDAPNALISRGSFQEDESSSDDEEPPPPPDAHGHSAPAKSRRRDRGTPSNSDSDLTDSEDEDG